MCIRSVLDPHNRGKMTINNYLLCLADKQSLMSPRVKEVTQTTKKAKEQLSVDQKVSRFYNLSLLEN